MTTWRITRRAPAAMSMVHRGSWGLALSLIVCTVASAATLTITTFDHDMDGIASGTGADTYIVEGDNVNYGTNNAMLVRRPPTNNASPNNRIGYVKFDLSAIANTSVTTSAKLQIYDFRYTDPPGNNSLNGVKVEVYGLKDATPNDYWNESNVSWLGTGSMVPAPGHQHNGTINDSLDLITADTVFLGDFTFTNAANPTTGWSQEVSLANLLALVQADTNDSLTLMFAIAPGQTNTNYFIATKEAVVSFNNGSNGVPLGSLTPRLILDGVELATVPEPSDMTIWILGGLGMFVTVFTVEFRRRRSQKCF